MAVKKAAKKVVKSPYVKAKKEKKDSSILMDAKLSKRIAEMQVLQKKHNNGVVMMFTNTGKCTEGMFAAHKIGAMDLAQTIVRAVPEEAKQALMLALIMDGVGSN